MVIIRGIQESQSQKRRCDDGHRGQSDGTAGFEYRGREVGRL